MNRTLALKKDTLADLTPDELGAVAGGTTQISKTCALLTFAPCLIVQSLLEGCLP